MSFSANLSSIKGHFRQSLSQKALLATTHSRKVKHVLPYSRKGTITWLTHTVTEEKELVTSTPSLSAKYTSILPPNFERETVLETFADGLWSLCQPFVILNADIKLRCVVAKLSDGSLLLHNPVAPTEEMLSLLRSLGHPVSHIVIGNTNLEHWIYAVDLCQSFPDAKIWLPPGFFSTFQPAILGIASVSKLKSRSNLRTLGEDKDLDDELAVETYKHPVTTECATVLRRYRTLLLSDTGIQFDASFRGVIKEVAEAAGVWERMGSPIRNVFEADKPASKVYLEGISRHDFDTIIPAHGLAPLAGGPAVLRDCFNFL